MKNLKKVLALVMAFAMAFTMFAGAVAFDDVELGSDYSAAITMLSDLEVISGDGKGNYNPNGTITRAEACVLIANMMNGGKADTARFAGGSNFSDVAYGWWAESAIAYCVQNGVAYGVGGGMFAPNREITDAEFVAMVTRAMGYDTAANPLSFPYGNYTAAVNNGIVDGVKYVEGSACTRGEAAQIIYDCLFADYARLVANQNTIHKADDNDSATLIEAVFGLEQAYATDKKGYCVAHEWVITSVSCEDEDEIFVVQFEDGSDDDFWAGKIECTADVSSLVGYKVALWGEDKHASGSQKVDGYIDTVLAVEVLDGQVAYNYNPSMDFEDDLGLDWDDNRQLKAMLTEKNGNSYVLIDWDDDGEIDWVNTTARYYGTVENLTSSKVMIKVDGQKYTLDLDGDETKKYGCDWSDEHDYTVALDAEEGDIVEITVDHGYDCALAISITTVEPTEMEFTKWNSKGDRYFDDAVAEDADVSFGDYTVDGMKKFQVGDNFDVYTNANGFVIAIKDVEDGESGYLMILGVENGAKKSIKSKSVEAVAEVMYTDGTTEEVTIAFDCKADVYSDDSYKWASEVGAGIVGGVYKFTTNDEGEIDSLALVNSNVRTKAYTYDEKYERITWGTGNTTMLTGDDFVFVVDDEYVVDDSDDEGVYYVDTDLVAVIAVEDLTDIDDEAAKMLEGAYAGQFAANTAVYKENQNKSADYVDGVVLSVEDLAKYLGTTTSVVGLLTYVEYDGDQYTFELVADGDEALELTTIDIDDDALNACDIEISDADAAVIEKIADEKLDLELEDEYGYGIYVYMEMQDDMVNLIELLVTVDGSEIAPKASTKCGYTVTRGVVASIAAKGGSLELIEGIAAEDAETIANLDEYVDGATRYDLADDVMVYVDAEIPGMVAGVELLKFLGLHEDSEFSVGDLDDVQASYWDKEAGFDEYEVVDLVIEDDEVVAIYVYSSVAEAEAAADDQN